MKVNVEIDCTPEEARRFLGLPDLGPMQQAVLAKLQAQMLDGAAATSPDALLKLWMPLLPQSADQVPQAMASLFRMFIPGGAPGGAPGGFPAGGGASGPAGGKTGPG